MNYLKILLSLVKGKNPLETAATACRLAAGVCESFDGNDTGVDDISATILQTSADVIEAVATKDKGKVETAIDAAIVGLQTLKAGLSKNGAFNN